MSMNGNKIFHVKYIRENAYGFIKGQIYEAFKAKSKFGETEMLCIIDSSGEEYGYPTAWFELVKEPADG